jgi:hypothetical protein
MRLPTPTSTSDPVRLREEGETTSLERALLGAGSSYKSSPQSRARVLAGLGIASSAALVGGSAAASVSSAVKFTWTKLLLGVSLVGATAAPVGYYALHRPTPSSPSHQSVASPAMRPDRAPAAGVEEDAPEASAPAAVHAAMLREELGALDHARLALASGNARRALDQLDAYDRRFPEGRLQVEAEVLRIDALAKLGHNDVARQHAEAFLKQHPNSVLATRVRALVAD